MWFSKTFVKWLILLFVYAGSCALMTLPFLSGEFDLLANPLATTVQIFSGAYLITCIPAFLWFIQVLRSRNQKNYTRESRSRIFIRTYLITACVATIPVLLIVIFGLSMLLGLSLSLFFISLFVMAFRKVSKAAQDRLNSLFYPVASGIFPVFLIVFQIISDQPLTDRSKKIAIENSKQFIEEIERYKSDYGTYPVTMNAIWKDYKTGIRGIEKYYYTNDDSSYNLYFEQPKFFFDRFGTRELVVYNPKDNHLMLSHASWHMRMSPEQRRRTQGWYAAKDMNIPHWKYFWFD